jgi:hypothetical protein
MRSTMVKALGWIAIGMAAVCALPSAGEAQRGARIGQQAPEIAGGPWVNSGPLTLASLRGRVVFVEFWTYG